MKNTFLAVKILFFYKQLLEFFLIKPDIQQKFLASRGTRC